MLFHCPNCCIKNRNWNSLVFGSLHLAILDGTASSKEKPNSLPDAAAKKLRKQNWARMYAMKRYATTCWCREDGRGFILWNARWFNALDSWSGNEWYEFFLFKQGMRIKGLKHAHGRSRKIFLIKVGRQRESEQVSFSFAKLAPFIPSPHRENPGKMHHVLQLVSYDASCRSVQH